MADRGHSVHRLRAVPALAGTAARSIAQLACVVVGLMWLDPAHGVAAVTAGIILTGLPLVVLPAVRERDMRLRAHGAALFQFYMDALLGVVPLRAHRAAPAMRQGQEGLLIEWSRTARDLGRVVTSVDAVQGMAGIACVAFLVIDHVARLGADGRVLLLAYWALQLPVFGQMLAQALRALAQSRNLTARLVEPLGAPDGQDGASPGDEQPERAPMSIDLCGASVRAAGHIILEGVDVRIAAGSHVAVVGPSGAGKSSLLGLILGLHRASDGAVEVDGVPLGDGQHLATVRAETVWLDPAVQVWNRSLLENIAYGNGASGAGDIGAVIEAADLRSLVGRLREGLRARLGEGGALVSGGEGQRVRLARALARRRPRLALLDEPFRGLDRDQRRAQLRRVREAYRAITLIVVTHDIADTRDFDRVLVIDGGRLVEEGPPGDLAAQEGSCYRALLEAEVAVRTGTLADPDWRRLRLVDGRLSNP
jgi:ATP-binding cassette subfamily B protein